MRHVVLRGCRIKGYSRCECIGERWRRLSMGSGEDTLNTGQGTFSDKIGRKSGSGVFSIGIGQLCQLGMDSRKTMGDTRISSFFLG